jgi:hypothetical protein
VPAVLCVRGAQQTLVVGEDGGVSIAELLYQARRPFDIREEEGNGAAGAQPLPSR